jgi:hypothetical protein
MKIAYDAVLQRPGCALLQAALGGHMGIASKFPTSSWLLAPTENLRVYEVTPAQLAVLIARAKAIDLKPSPSIGM